jgi:hypothetical protein
MDKKIKQRFLISYCRNGSFTERVDLYTFDIEGYEWDRRGIQDKAVAYFNELCIAAMRLELTPLVIEGIKGIFTVQGSGLCPVKDDFKPVRQDTKTWGRLEAIDIPESYVRMQEKSAGKRARR